MLCMSYTNGCIMGRPKSDRDTKPINFRMSVDLIDRVRAIAERERRPLVTQLEIIIEAGLEALEAKKGAKR
jgi:predicted DNA-binding protein